MGRGRRGFSSGSIGAAQWPYGGDSPYPVGGYGVAGYDYAIGQAVANALQQAGIPTQAQVNPMFLQRFLPPLSGPPVVGGFGQGVAIPVQPQELAGAILAFESASMAQNVSDTLTEHAQNDFRPERFTVDSGALTFTISDIKVGTESQLLNNQPVPASVFSALALDTRFKMKTICKGQDVAVAITQTGVAAAVFRAAMIGTQLK